MIYGFDRPGSEACPQYMQKLWKAGIKVGKEDPLPVCIVTKNQTKTQASNKLSAKVIVADNYRCFVFPDSSDFDSELSLLT